MLESLEEYEKEPVFKPKVVMSLDKINRFYTRAYEQNKDKSIYSSLIGGRLARVLTKKGGSGMVIYWLPPMGSIDRDDVAIRFTILEKEKGQYSLKMEHYIDKVFSKKTKVV